MTLSCNATGNPEPTISWTRNGSPINITGNSRISFTAGKKELFITNVNRTDSGEYRCVANNSPGNDTSRAATLNIQCKYQALLFFIFPLLPTLLDSTVQMVRISLEIKMVSDLTISEIWINQQ